MRIACRIALIGTAIALLLIPLRGRTENAQQFGDYVILYNALSADHLLPAMAKAYGIERSSARGLVNVTVQKKTDAAFVTATLKGTATDLSGHRVPVRFREIKEGDSVSYLGEFPAGSADTWTFRIEVTPQGSTRPYQIEFSQDYVGN